MKVSYVFILELLGFRYYVLHKNSFTPNVGEPVPMKHQYQMPRKNNVNDHFYKTFKLEYLKAKTFLLFFNSFIQFCLL